nr:MAG TPA: hypothetical protein [Caudoviricetes sp.]
MALMGKPLRIGWFFLYDMSLLKGYNSVKNN